ncbi:hypothetical protein D3C73_641900 [compost metagenome]
MQKTLVVLFMLLLTFIFSGCIASNKISSTSIQTPSQNGGSTYESSDDSPIKLTSPDISSLNSLGMQFNEYVNARYGFSIKYPAEWTAGEESDNGDGKILYVGNPDVDIRVYASNYLEGISNPYQQEDKNFQLQKIKLDNGEEATLMIGKQNDKVVYEMVYISQSDVEYHFYVNVSDNFFQNNEKVLLKVAKSMDFHD